MPTPKHRRSNVEKAPRAGTTKPVRQAPLIVSIGLNFHVRPELRNNGKRIVLSLAVESSIDGEEQPPSDLRLEVPAGIFKREGQSAEWAAATNKAFFRRLIDVLLFEARLHYADVGNYFLDAQRVQSIPMRDVLEAHIALLRPHLKMRLGVRSGGRHSAWTKPALESAIRSAFATLKKRERNYNGVTKELRRTHPEKAPPTAAALKQLVKRHSVDWKRLKSNT